MDGEDEGVVLISALEAWSYCPRQCGLIHLEAVWDENLYTLRGKVAHERVDTGPATTEEGVRVVRGLPLWNDALGLYGKADAVEFHPGPAGAGETPFPVEYKVGERRAWVHEAIQLCAQALCLEEMFGVAVPAGAVYYHRSRRRRPVAFDAALRGQTLAAVEAVRAMLQGERLPPAADDARCPNCAQIESCLPGIVSNARRVGAFRSGLYAPMAVGEVE